MNPDAGAIIGISLAGSVLIVAVFVLCMINLPCCNHQLKQRRGGGTPRTQRPSTSSRSAILNFPFSGNSRHVRPLPALDLHTQNQRHPRFLNGSSTGLVNPLWQVQCHSCGVFVTASQHSLNHQHQCANQVVPCHCCHHPGEQPMGHSPNLTSTTSTFQYSAPQLVPTAETPPPYPGTPNIEVRSHIQVTELTNDNDTSSQRSNPPPYNPKY